MLPAWLTGALAVHIQADLHFGSTGLGIAVAAFSLVSALGSIPAGRFVERRGWRTGTLASLGGLTLAMVGVAVLARSWAGLVVLLALAGLGCALSSPAANMGLASGVRPDRQGLAFGLKQAAVPASTLLAGAAVPTIALTLGWRAAFGLAALLTSAFAFFVPRRIPVRPSRARLREASAGVAPLVVLGVGAGLGTAATHSIGAFLVVSVAARGFDPQIGGLLLAGGGALSAVVRIVSGWLADRRGSGLFAIVAAMLAAGALGTGGLALDAGPVVLVAATTLAFAFGWSWNGLFDFALIRRVPEAPATATGVAQTGKFIGGVAGPLLFGVAADQVGFAVAWVAAAVVLLAAAVTVLVGRALLRSALLRSADDGAAPA